MDRDIQLKISLVIPVYQQAKTIAAAKLSNLLIRLRHQHDVEVIFVDDGSRDQTGTLLKTNFADDEQVRVVSHDSQRGVGQALHTGFSHATGDIVITIDFDETYNLNTIPQILAHLLVYDVDVVTASAYQPKGGLHIFRHLFQPGVCYLYRLLVKRDIHTWTALFRAYRREVLDNVSFESKGAFANTELLVKAIQSGYTVSEYPISAQSSGHSFVSLKDHLRYQMKLMFSAKTEQHQHTNLAQRRT